MSNPLTIIHELTVKGRFSEGMIGPISRDDIINLFLIDMWAIAEAGMEALEPIAVYSECVIEWSLLDTRTGDVKQYIVTTSIDRLKNLSWDGFRFIDNDEERARVVAMKALGAARVVRSESSESSPLWSIDFVLRLHSVPIRK